MAIKPMMFKKKYLLAKAEADYATDPTPDGANAILTSNLSITPYEGNRVSRDVDRQTLGNSEEINTGPYVTITCDVEIAGAGTAGEVPGWGVLARACGMSETIIEETPGTPTAVEYQPVSDDFESVTLYYLVENQLHKATGVRGNISFDLSRGALPKMSLTFTGLWHAPETLVTPPTVDTTAFIAPIPVTYANTPIYKVGTYECRAEAFTMDVANNVVYRNVVNSESVIITDRAPAGSMTVEAPRLAEKNMFELASSHNGITTSALEIEHGTTDGNKFAIKAPKVQLSSISMNDSDGLLTYQMDTRFIATDAGDDEFVITVK